jgi:hypothetical protein
VFGRDRKWLFGAVRAGFDPRRTIGGNLAAA